MAAAAGAAAAIAMSANRRSTMYNSPKTKEEVAAFEREAAAAFPFFMIIMVFNISIALLFILCKIKCNRRSIASKKTKPLETDMSYSKRVGTVTQIPITPFPQKDLYVFTGNANVKNVIPEARIQCSSYGTEGDLYSSAVQEMNSIMLWIFGLENVLPDEYEEGEQGQYQKKPKIVVPYDVRIISIKMENFKHGFRCYDFIPVDGISRGSYYTYQMFGDNRIQVTNYVENGITYVAGFCIYIPTSNGYGKFYQEKVIKDCLNSRKYPGKKHYSASQRTNVTAISRAYFNEFEQPSREAEVTERTKEMVNSQRTANDLNQKHTEDRLMNQENFSEECSSTSIKIRHRDEVPVEEMTIRYCQKLQRYVMTGVKSGIVIHQEWNHVANKMRREECQMCTELLNNEEPPAYSSLSLA